MDKRKRALALIACAVVLAVGSYLLFMDASQDPSVHTQAVAPPETTGDESRGPDWIDQGQTAQPDYSAATSDAVNATPAEVKPEPTVIEVREDRVVTFTFVESLADFFLHRFNPDGRNGKPETLVSAKALNMYYGRELDGFSVPGDDIRQGRKTVLDYAFTPSMIETLSALYSPVFMAHIVETAAETPREYGPDEAKEVRTLSNSETSEMLRINARIISQTADVLRAIASDPSIPAQAGKYLQAQRAVERANAQLQTAIADGKDAKLAGQRLKQAILERERISASVIAKLKPSCLECTDSTLFYLGQWSYRRVLNAPNEKLPAFTAAADALDNLSKAFLERSREIVAQ